MGFDICTMLNLMSNLLSFKKIMKLHENLVEIHPILYPNLLNLVSNSTSCWKFMQLYEKMVGIRLIWWPLDGFYSLTCWVWCKFSFLLKIYAITWEDDWNTSYLVVPYVFWPPLMYWIKSRNKNKCSKLIKCVRFG